jgi:hypothetical protein
MIASRARHRQLLLPPRHQRGHLTQRLNLGFRNMVYVEAGARSWRHQMGLTIPGALSEPGRLMLTVTASGYAGSSLGLIADRFTSEKEMISLKPVQLTGRRCRPHGGPANRNLGQYRKRSEASSRNFPHKGSSGGIRLVIFPTAPRRGTVQQTGRPER